MSENKLDPETKKELKKAVWKIVIYAVTLLAAAFGGNVAAKNGYRIINHQNQVSCLEMFLNQSELV